MRISIQWQKISVISFFVLYFLLGVLIFRHYGMTWDDPLSRLHGIMAYEYITGESSRLLTYVDRDYGTAYELPLVVIEKVFNITSPQQIFYMRHFLTWLFFFVGTIFFYKLANKRFGWKIALLGVVFLILTPRIFAHSFYNSKDTVLAAAMIMAVYTMVYFLTKPTWRRALIHGVVCALVVDIRMPGLFIVPLTLGFFTLDSIFVETNHQRWLQRLKTASLYIVLFFMFVVIFWPYLWSSPLGHFWESLVNLSKFIRFNDFVLYLGKEIRAGELPWHYAPLWIMISTPLVYIAFFFTGLGVFLRRLLTNWSQYQKYRDDLIYIAWFFVPLLMVLLLNSVVYDDFRQLYFIYPAFILIALMGVEFTINWAKNFKKWRMVILGSVGAVTVINIAAALFFMIHNHPYQNLYFNILAGGMKNAKQNFDLDYWGLTFREGLEYIAKNDPSLDIPVFFSHGHQDNIAILKDEDRKRFIPLAIPEGAKYILTNYRWHKEDYAPDLEKVYSVKIDEVEVMSVFKFY